MGVYCVKERKTASKETELYLDKQVDTLELYLNDVYEKECVFKIEEEEVEFIQTGIETLVNKIAYWILDYFEEQKLQQNLDEGLSEILKNREHTTSPNEIIKVGSFYDGTKNGFPDEFDFIFPLYSSDNSLYCSKDDGGIHIPGTTTLKVCFITFTGLSYVTNKYTDLLQYTSADGKRKLYFDKHYDAKGPAGKLLFIYKCRSDEKRDIQVDFVPAIKVTGDKLEQAVNATCKLTEFRTEVLHTGSYLLIGDGGLGVTFTETEQRFMKNILAKGHIKVYRILKFLVNGHEDGETLGCYLREERPNQKVYTSYMMKIMMVRHHYKCTNSDPNKIGACLLEVLDEMSEYEDIDSFPWLASHVPAAMQIMTNFLESTSQVGKFFFGFEDAEYPISVVPYLQSVNVYLRSLQKSDKNNNYDYDRDRIKKSVSQMYLDNLTTLYERTSNSWANVDVQQKDSEATPN